jgi:hypothetical protein
VSPSRHVARDRATYPWPYSKMLLKDTSSSGIVIPCDYFTGGNMKTMSEHSAARQPPGYSDATIQRMCRLVDTAALRHRCTSKTTYRLPCGWRWPRPASAGSAPGSPAPCNHTNISTSEQHPPPTTHNTGTHRSPCLMSQVSWSIEIVSSCIAEPRNTCKRAATTDKSRAPFTTKVIGVMLCQMYTLQQVYCMTAY